MGIREGDWKLVAAKPDLKWELFNIAEDWTEMHDLIDSLPEKAKELERKYMLWEEENGVLIVEEP